jgi:hypothetical protein
MLRADEGRAPVTTAEEGYSAIEKNQEELRHCIDEAKRLAEASQQLLDRSADHSNDQAQDDGASKPRAARPRRPAKS